MEPRRLRIDSFRMTRHAEARIQQRGIRRESIDLVLHDSDIEVHAGDGLMSLQLSRRRLAQLAESGVPANVRENAQNVVLLVDYATQSLVTAMHSKGKRGKRHSRQFPTRRKIANAF